MAYETVRSLLDRIVRLHQQLKELYGRLEGEVQRARVKLLLDYCRGQEEKLGSTTAEFERNASPALLGTWFSFTPDLSRWKELASVEISPDATLDQATNAVLAADQAIIDLYREILDNSDTGEVKDLFENLIQHAEKMRNQFANDARSLAES